MDEMKMVKIVAEDWRLDGSNMEIEKATALMPAVCIVVGMLLNESKKRVVICQEHFKEEDTVRSLVVVPTACILSIVELKMSTIRNFTYPMEEVRIKNSKWENQTLFEQCVAMVDYIDVDPEQKLVPPGRLNLIKKTLAKIEKEIKKIYEGEEK
ncbi:hypothetical protein LCGC14_0460690 [marine sediment metagenome]|uniref:Uncharacterized protein n=1 Tax=marine sediment metagenome TaxID=412755 RepID=A0A0F9SXX2_9ZZZZ|nr:hypothetical protein [bacterium]